MAAIETITNDGGKATLTPEAVDELAASLRGDLITASDAAYDEVRQIWNGMHDKKPALIARCTGVADVIDAVNFARSHQLLVSVRGGGHNVAGTASNDGGMMIDLSLMRSVHVDARAKTARVQGGATLGDLDRETQVYGLAATGGNVSTTGVAGLTLGGGLGHLRRKYGLAVDNVKSVDIVTADGKVRRASEDENEELYWGIRGGGGNFGVVTSFEFRLYEVGPMVTLCAPWYDMADGKEVLTQWVQFMKGAPEELSSIALLWTVPAAPDFPEEHHGKRAIILAGVHCGPVKEGEKVVQPLRELATPLLDMSGAVPYVGVQSAFDPFFPKGQRNYYFKSSYLKGLDEAAIDTLLPKAANPPSGAPVLIAIWHLGGAMHRVKSSDTAFPERSAPFLFSVDAIWDDPGQKDEVIAYSRAYLEEMKPHSRGGLYVNFAGLGEEGEDLVKAAYGDNYERLVALKNEYDPTNLFRLNQNIKPSA